MKTAIFAIVTGVAMIGAATQNTIHQQWIPAVVFGVGGLVMIVLGMGLRFNLHR